MKKNKMFRLISFLVFAGFLTGGFVGTTVSASENSSAAMAAVEKKETNILKGKIAGVSKKAKSISIIVGKGDKEKVVMLKFDENSQGMSHAIKDEAAIIHFEVRGADKYATVVKPKLATLPDGVTEMLPEDLAQLVELGLEKGSYFLVDSRPATRYAAGHIPSSISIPVELMSKNGAELLPADKDIMLVFYCGGPT